MRRRPIWMTAATLLMLVATAARADMTALVRNHALSATQGFAGATAALAEAARSDCTAAALRPGYQAASDAWLGLSHLTFGPLEQDGRALTVSFWPDPRGAVARAVPAILAAQDDAVDDPAAFAQVSIAARGLVALDRVLFDPALAGYGGGDYTCRYVQAVTADLARIGAAIDGEWADYGAAMNTAGQPGNSRFLSPDEPQQMVYTALLSGLEFDADQRLGRPMGSFDKPRPKLAEAWRSGRAARNIALSLAALRDLATDLADRPIPQTQAGFDRAIATAQALADSDPSLAGVATPQGRLKAEILQQQIQALRDTAEAEIGAAMGLSAGFNAQDGD